MSTTDEPRSPPTAAALTKAPTGIAGFDELTGGGLPRGRPSLVSGGPGCGKTLFAMEFLVNGATRYDEPGVFVSFEESAGDLVTNFASLGFELPRLLAERRLVLDEVGVQRDEIEHTGDWDLEGLFVRLGWAIDQVGARRVVLDTLEALFAGFGDEAVLRRELLRLFDWLKARGTTAVITAERGDGGLTRHGIEEYVSDCVLLLDHRVDHEVSTRRLRVVKYRGSAHGTNEYPFHLDEHGFTLLPVTSLSLDQKASEERVSTGVVGLDAILGGGVYRGSSTQVSGPPGSGKTTLAAHFVDAACARGERGLYLAFEESPPEVVRNMRTVGLDLTRWLDADVLRILADRPTSLGIEAHLARLTRQVAEWRPAVVVVDPMSALAAAAQLPQVRLALLRVVDFLKASGVTALLVATDDADATAMAVSSLMDTHLVLRDVERDGERRHVLHVAKSRGTAHSKRVHAYAIGSGGIEVVADGGGDGDG